MTSKWIFINMPRYNIHTQKSAASPVRHPTLFGTTTVPRPPHTSALGVPGERTVANAPLGERGERGAWRGPLPGIDLSLPGNWEDPRQRRDLQHLRRPCPPGVAPTLTSRQLLQTLHTKFILLVSTIVSNFRVNPHAYF